MKIKKVDPAKEKLYEAKIRSRLKQKFEEENRREAVHFTAKHNRACPDDRLILHGTYSRKIKVWCEQLERMITLKVKITRIRSKGQRKTFSFQGGTFIIRARYGGKFLLGMLARLAGRSGSSFDDICFDYGVPPRTARMYRSRLNDYLKKSGHPGFFNAPKIEEIPDLFIKQMWYTEGNPFCSVLEASV